MLSILATRRGLLIVLRRQLATIIIFNVLRPRNKVCTRIVCYLTPAVVRTWCFETVRRTFCLDPVVPGISWSVCSVHRLACITGPTTCTNSLWHDTARSTRCPEVYAQETLRSLTPVQMTSFPWRLSPNPTLFSPWVSSTPAQLLSPSRPYVASATPICVLDMDMRSVDMDVCSADHCRIDSLRAPHRFL